MGGIITVTATSELFVAQCGRKDYEGFKTCLSKLVIDTVIPF